MTITFKVIGHSIAKEDRANKAEKRRISNRHQKSSMRDRVAGGKGGRIYEWMDGWMDTQTNRQMDGWMDGCMRGWMHGLIDG